MGYNIIMRKLLSIKQVKKDGFFFNREEQIEFFKPYKSIYKIGKILCQDILCFPYYETYMYDSIKNDCCLASKFLNEI